MFSITAMGRNFAPHTDAGKDASVRVVFPTPKSERNLESNFVFPNSDKTSEKSDERRGSDETSRKEGTVPTDC
jgi:hypothetical protein